MLLLARTQLTVMMRWTARKMEKDKMLRWRKGTLKQVKLMMMRSTAVMMTSMRKLRVVIF